VKYRRMSLGAEENGAAGGKPVRRRRGAVAVLPALFTLGNCIAGFASLHYAAKGMVVDVLPRVAATGAAEPMTNFSIAGYLIFLAMVCDVFDGFIARLARATSDFGAELDSLADMVSFGVAPAFLAMQVISAVLMKQYPGSAVIPAYEALGPNADDTMGKLFWIIGAIYVACAALRLARFNVFNKHEASAHVAFRGLPSPGAAGVVASSVLFFESLHARTHVFNLKMGLSEEAKNALLVSFPYVMPALLLAAALLMVSRFSYSHLVNRYLRGRRGFNYMVRVAVVALLWFWQPQITTLVAIYYYAASAPVAWAWKRVRGKGDVAVEEKGEATSDQ